MRFLPIRRLENNQVQTAQPVAKIHLLALRFRRTRSDGFFLVTDTEVGADAAGRPLRVMLVPSTTKVLAGKDSLTAFGP